MALLSKDALIERLQDIEWEDFEVKEARNEIPKSIWETVSAFSNTDGGWIVLGVKQQGEQFEIVGVENVEKLEQDFISTLRSQKFNTKLFCEAQKYDIDGKDVLLFHIPSSPTKPVYFNSPANTFIRMGSGDQHATENEMIAMYHDQSFGIRSELPVPESDSSMLNPASLDSYRRFLEAFNPTKSYYELNNEDFCKRFNILTKKGELTYAGLLMFGKNDEVLRYVPTFCMDYIEMPTPSAALSSLRYTYRIPEPENLWEAYLSVSRRLEGLVNKPYHVNKHGIGVEDLSAYEILREAWLNMLMHTDFFSPMRSCVHVFPDHVEFLNAGSLPLPLEEIEARLYSSSRNPTIAKLFRFTKLCENAGYGMGKLRSWKRITGCEMDIHTERTLTCTTFWYDTSIVTYLDSDVTSDVTSLDSNVTNNVTNSGEDVTNNVTNSGEDVVNSEGDVVNNVVNSEDDVVSFGKAVLQLIESNNKISAIKMAQQLNFSQRQIKRIIARLKAKGYLRREGSATKGGYWVICKEYKINK